MTEAQWLASADPVAMLLFATENPDHQDIACCRSERKLSLIKEAWESPLCGNERWCLGFVPGCDGRIADPLLAVQINIMTKYKPVAADILRDIVGNPFRPVALPLGPKCERCKGKGTVPAGAGGAVVGRPDRVACKKCKGIGHQPCPHLTPLVVSLAQAAYDHRAADGTLEPDRLMILSDALEEAGFPTHVSITLCCCGSPRDGTHDHNSCGPPIDETTEHPLLAHLRKGRHWRGCWAVDIILGKE